MKEDVKLLICDIDGTLVEKGGAPLQKTERALKLFHEEGVLLGLASGRPADFRLKGKFREWGYDFDPDIVIGFNGCEVWDRFSDNKRQYNFLEKEETEKILEYIWPLDVNVITYGNGYDAVIARRKDHLIEASMKRNRSIVSFSDKKEDFLRHDVPKLEIHYDEEKYEEEILKIIEEHRSKNYTCTKTYTGTLEFMKPGIDKGIALERICGEMNISLEKVVACGDMDNDIAMLKTAGTGICLLNGSEETKKAADYITEKDVSHDGLGEYLLEHYF